MKRKLYAEEFGRIPCKSIGAQGRQGRKNRHPLSPADRMPPENVGQCQRGRDCEVQEQEAHAPETS